jgi:hypothetical protein
MKGPIPILKALKASKPPITATYPSQGRSSHNFRLLQFIAAGVKHDKLCRRASPVQQSQHIVELHAVVPKRSCTRFLSIDRDQVIDVGGRLLPISG